MRMRIPSRYIDKMLTLCFYRVQRSSASPPSWFPRSVPPPQYVTFYFHAAHGVLMLHPFDTQAHAESATTSVCVPLHNCCS